MKPNPRHLSRALALSLVAAAAGLSASCVAVAAAAVGGLGYVQYDRNEILRDFPTDLQTTWDATLDALGEFDLNAGTTKFLDRNEGTVDGKDVWIKVERHPEGYTRVRVRLGTFATEDHVRRSNLLLNAIQGRLGVETWQPGSTEPAGEPTVDEASGASTAH